MAPPTALPEGASMSVEEIETELGTALLMKNLARLLHRARTSKKLSLAEVGARLNVSKARVHQLEEKGANLEIATLCRVADALGYDVLVTFKERDKGKAITAPVRMG